MKLIKKYWPILLVLIAGILAARTLLFERGYFNMHDDLQMMRQLEMEKCFIDLQIPCRWVPDMGYGFGFPLFNFYPPLPYLIGEIFRLVGFSFIETVKLTFTLSIILSGVGMYFLGKEFFGKTGGILSSVFYLWAPYHAVDVYVRGAMNESWALVFFPLIFLFSYRLIKRSRGVIPLALAYAGLLLSHNLMVLIFTPVFALWCFLWIWRLKKNLISSIKLLFPVGLISLGLSAFFTIPAIAENGFTWVKSQLVGYYDYTAHFVTLRQLLISRFWGYGPSVWLEYDGMSFQIGHIHWILSLAMAAWLVLERVRKRKLDNLSLMIMYLLAIGWFAAFLTHVRSTPIYQAIPILGYVQFPWRFLTIIIFVFSLLAGVVPLLFKSLGKKYSYFSLVILAVGIVVFNWNYFLPEHGKMGPLTDKEKFSAAAWDLQQTAGIYDYLPATAKEAPKAPQGALAEIIKGEGKISDMKQGTDWVEFKSNITSHESGVRINILMFPGWKAFMDGRQIQIKVPDEERWGRMWLEIPQGEHKISAKFVDTPIRTISNVVSVFSWALLLLQLTLWKRNNTLSRAPRLAWKRLRKGL